MLRASLAFVCIGALLAACGCSSVGSFDGQSWYVGETVVWEDLWEATERAMRIHSGSGISAAGEFAGHMQEVNRDAGYLETDFVFLERERVAGTEFGRKIRARVNQEGSGWEVIVFVGQYQRASGPHLNPDEGWSFDKREGDVEEAVIGTIKALLSNKYGTRMGTRKPPGTGAPK